MKIPKSSPSKKRKSDEDSDDGDYVPASDGFTNNNKTLTSQRHTRSASQDNKPRPTDKVPNLRQERPQSQTDTAGPRLRVAIDIGTTWTKAAFQFYESSDPSERTQVWPVAWDSDTFQTPSTLTHQNGRLLWSAELERQLSIQAIPESRVMRHFKLALHSDARVRGIQDKVMSCLLTICPNWLQKRSAISSSTTLVGRHTTQTLSLSTLSLAYPNAGLLNQTLL